MQLLFKPPWWSTLIVLGLCGLFIKLGFWQLDRAAQKEAKHQVYQTQAAQPMVSLNDTFNRFNPPNPETLLWREVTTQGHYQPVAQVLLDNQIHQSQAGYQVFSLLAWQPDQPWLWVNRGWLPLTGDRQTSPDLPLATQMQTLQGRLTLPPAAPLLLQPEITEQLNPNLWRVQRIDLAVLAEYVNQPTLPYVLTLTEPQASSLQPIWQPPGNNAQKHYGYAFQWFAFTVTLIVIYLLMNLRRVHSEPL